jgi:hypothetical protein
MTASDSTKRITLKSFKSRQMAALEANDTITRISIFRKKLLSKWAPSRPFLASAQAYEKIVQLREGLGHPALHSGHGAVERFLGGIEFAHDQQRLAAFFLEGQCGDGAVVAFFIRPDEARVRRHFDIFPEERHKRR